MPSNRYDPSFQALRDAKNNETNKQPNDWGIQMAALSDKLHGFQKWGGNTISINEIVAVMVEM